MTTNSSMDHSLTTLSSSCTPSPWYWWSPTSWRPCLVWTAGMRPGTPHGCSARWCVRVPGRGWWRGSGCRPWRRRSRMTRTCSKSRFSWRSSVCPSWRARWQPNPLWPCRDESRWAWRLPPAWARYYIEDLMDSIVRQVLVDLLDLLQLLRGKRRVFCLNGSGKAWHGSYTKWWVGDLYRGITLVRAISWECQSLLLDFL